MPGTKSAFAAAIGRRALDAWIRLRYVAKARAVMRPPPRESSVGANKRERQEGAEGGVSACLLACQTVSLPAIPPTTTRGRRRRGTMSGASAGGIEDRSPVRSTGGYLI